MHIFLKLDLLRCVFFLVCIAFVQVLSVILMVNIKKINFVRLFYTYQLLPIHQWFVSDLPRTSTQKVLMWAPWEGRESWGIWSSMKRCLLIFWSCLRGSVSHVPLSTKCLWRFNGPSWRVCPFTWLVADVVLQGFWLWSKSHPFLQLATRIF